MGVRAISLVLALAALPAVLSLSGCGDSKVTLSPDNKLVSTKVTEGDREPIWPNDDPSIPDGQGVYAAQNCAQCHGADGKGSAKVDLSDKTWARKQKPVEQYDFITFGKQGVEHPVVRDKLRPSEIWNLVFYVRSLSTPPLTDTEIGEIDAVFGGNCAVCHGKKGYGNGPLMKGNTLEPLPANFQSFPRFYDRTDDVLWDHIANGIKWEGMPNFLNKVDKTKNVKFDEPYIWKMVGYIRHFHESNKSEMATKAAHVGEAEESKKQDTLEDLKELTKDKDLGKDVKDTDQSKTAPVTPGSSAGQSNSTNSNNSENKTTH
ncbi:MAG: c-type cytochrome [Candidatus Obscuribacter sp.]|nr:c-type cytochrome [Candidatus Obscuribacter sp.]